MVLMCASRVLLQGDRAAARGVAEREVRCAQGAGIDGIIGDVDVDVAVRIKGLQKKVDPPRAPVLRPGVPVAYKVFRTPRVC